MKQNRQPTAWWIAAVLVLAGGAGLFAMLQWIRTDARPLPDISTAQLDPSAARLIERHLNAVRAAPRSGAAWGKLGSVLKTFDYRQEARRCFEAAERFDPREPRWPYHWGTLLATDDPASAIEKWRRAVALCGNEPDVVRLRLARLLMETGQSADARRELETLLRDKPGHPPALLALAHVEHARGANPEARALASRCTSDRRTARAAWTLLATLQLRTGDTNAARTAGDRAATLPTDAPVSDPFEEEILALRSDPRDLSDRAQRLLMSGQLAEAAPLVNQLVRDHAQFAEGWLLEGRWRNLRKEFPRAEVSLRRHLELDPTSINGHFQLGMALLGLDRYGEAASVFERAIQLKPDFGPAFFNLGLALARTGRKAEAVPAFRSAIRLNPERIDSYILLADLHLQLGQRAEAVELARLAQILDPADRRLATLKEKVDRAGQ